MRPLLLALTLLTGLSATPALAQNRFWLINEAGLAIEHAYVSPSRLSDWGNDILGGTRVGPGEQVRVTPAAKDCVLDIKVEYEGGQAEEKMEVDACRLDRVIFTNPSGRAEGPGGTVDMASGGRVDGGEDALLPATLPHPGGTAQGLQAFPAYWPGVALAGQAGPAMEAGAAFAGRRPRERRHVAAHGQPETAWP